jgi:hypothetical protein
MKAKKIIRIISNVITVFFVVACVFAVIVTISAKKRKDGGFSVFGVQSRIVETQSMDWPNGTTLESFELETDEIKSLSDLKIKAIPLHSMVFISVVPENNAEEWYDQLKVSDVLTIMYGEYGVVNGKQPVITHRITKIEPKTNGGYIISLEGDNKGLTSETQSTPADTLTQYIDTTSEGVNYIIGKVVGQSVFLGNVIYVLKQPIGIVLVVMVPCAIIIIFEIIKIVKLYSGEKKKKIEEDKKAKEEEIEELKKQLQALQNQQNKEADGQ